jgi:hypothetical protein
VREVVLKGLRLALLSASGWWGIECLPAADAGERPAPRAERAAEPSEYGQRILQASGRQVPVRSSRPPAVANNRGVVGKDPVETVDPLEDPFADPFAEGVPSVPPPKVRSTPVAPRTPVRSQPATKRAPTPVVEDEDPQPMPVMQLPVIKSQPVPRRPATKAAPAGPVFSEPAETTQPPVLKSVPKTPPPAQRSALDEGYECPSPSTLKKIDQILPAIAVTGDLPTECTLGNEMFVDRNYCELTYQWKASSLCSKPLYFEDEQLERYGRLRHPLVQPVVSGARFFADCAVVPYKMGVDRPRDCVYALGYYRPGTCVPGFRKAVFPLDADGVVLEALFVGSMIALIP